MRKSNGFTLMEVMIALAIMGVLVVGVIGLVGGATKSATRQSMQAAQNGEMRTGMQTIQNSLSNADRPLMYVPAMAVGGQNVAKGNEIVFSRTEDRGPSKPVVYAAERLRLINANGNTASVGEESRLVLQRIVLPQSSSDRQSKIAELSDPYAATSEWRNAPTKVLLDKVQPDKPFFSFKASAGKDATVVTSSSGTMVDDVSLVDVNITRDADGSENRYASANLKTSIYLRKVGGRSTLSNPVGCEN